MTRAVSSRDLRLARIGADDRLSPCVKTCADQYDAENQGPAAHHGWDDVGGVLRRLELDIADLGDLLRLLGGEYRHGQPKQAEKSQNYATDHQPVHTTHGDSPYTMRVCTRRSRCLASMTAMMSSTKFRGRPDSR